VVDDGDEPVVVGASVGWVEVDDSMSEDPAPELQAATTRAKAQAPAMWAILIRTPLSWRSRDAAVALLLRRASTPTAAEATWLPLRGITVAGQRRDLTGLRSAVVSGHDPERTRIVAERDRPRSPTPGRPPARGRSLSFLS
jgi:hypothetical protein